MLAEVSVGTIYHIVIAIYKTDIFALSYGHTRVSGRAKSLVLLMGDDADEVGIPLDIVGKDGSTTVGGTVVHTDDFPLAALHPLPQQGVEAAGQETLHVIDGYDDG
jgi:hypothetical protein